MWAIQSVKDKRQHEKKISKEHPRVGAEKPWSEPASQQRRAGGRRHLYTVPRSHPTVNEAAGCGHQAEV